MLARLRDFFPQSGLRPHANVRLSGERWMLDATSYLEDARTLEYFQRYREVARILGHSVVSIHAGHRRGS